MRLGLDEARTVGEAPLAPQVHQKRAHAEAGATAAWPAAALAPYGVPNLAATSRGRYGKDSERFEGQRSRAPGVRSGGPW